MEQFAHFSNSETNVINHTLDIRDRLNLALRLVDEIANAPARAGSREPVTASDVERILSVRRKRSEFFDSTLFADPAWDILLELYAAELGQRRVSVGCLSLGAAVPATTALRWIKLLENRGMVRRNDDPLDGRRVFVTLTSDAKDAMDRFFVSVPQQGLFL